MDRKENEFAQIARKHRGTIYTVCYMFSENPEQVNDLFQEILYRNIMSDLPGIEALVYGISGHQMNQIIGQAEKLEDEHSQDFDATMVFAGTNDFNSSVPVGEGEYIDAYAESIRQAGSIWAVPVIDLNAECGLYPMDSAYEHYFRNTKTDLLHPNTKGHYRMALTIAYRMLCVPAL